MIFQLMEKLDLIGVYGQVYDLGILNDIFMI